MDMLRRIADGRDVSASKPADYHVVGARTSVKDAAERRWGYLKGAWRALRDSVGDGGDPAGLAIENWLLPLFDELGFGRLPALHDGIRSELSFAGDTFEMDMDREPLGDVDMGKYKSLNTVTKIIPDALLEWNVGSAERGPYGHVYGWQITAVSSDASEVTNYCDWTNAPEKARPHFPIVPRSMMEKSVENLAAIVARTSDRPG